MTLPNKISIFRLFLIPVIVAIWVFPFAQFGIDLPVYHIGNVSISLKNIIVMALFAIGSISDFLDGYLARKNNQVTTFGKFIDPIADKCLTTTLFILLASSQIIPAIPVIVMVWRDTIVDGTRMMAAGKGTVMAAGILGKIKTASQMFCIIFTLLNNYPFEAIGLPVSSILLWFSMIISVLGGIDYYNRAKAYIWETK
ncbi:MAG: CDP-diacylglycerol--glycerol-3-phosphate 3-phosphatidyltransferase [Erysipelotrichaceae bacterium]|nr:CDP-diacylglycerol--glycerol-3-phosphate 3-phosphatidyltransferase [Erysipelotrichaceae bacterium]MBR2544572.1 CDP-diacylglycerol--glycerol-3-phosphate 3-phosphatidyltransferase [Erysipelotrichaceae bacterium]MBR2700717.1 CDP-diacylglycerol--glycerol-3-phosphate 3-phosphatidyltransferase [Erysipelotrichaceae bacterium]MBR2745495.1 CDP-diacylglycerol--glycerol-3-phosphate 3-phosphatidyltransferase [Erysipelotrichaceae bacterium]